MNTDTFPVAPGMEIVTLVSLPGTTSPMVMFASAVSFVTLIVSDATALL